MSALAREWGITRQALAQRMQRMKLKERYDLEFDYYVDGVCVTHIQANALERQVHIVNYVRELSKCAFGWKEQPNWEDLNALLERMYLSEQHTSFFEMYTNKYERYVPYGEEGTFLCFESKRTRFSLEEAVPAEHIQSDTKLPIFTFRKTDLRYARTDTDGFQMKALSHDRKWFVKTQAVISGKLCQDWAVEVIASDLCEQLGISCVYQKGCIVYFEKQKYQGVYSANFELDGYTFISFESLLGRLQVSDREESYIRLSAIEKLEWCADKLAEAGNLPREKTFRYMLDLAVVDCLVGNVDRHNRNFGLFYDMQSHEFMIPPIFDNGMGLFEHDYYRDEHESFEDAMRSVYVAPYGEDPFDMMEMMMEAYDMHALYPELSSIRYLQILSNPFVEEYERRMVELCQR